MYCTIRIKASCSILSISVKGPIGIECDELELGGQSAFKSMPYHHQRPSLSAVQLKGHATLAPQSSCLLLMSRLHEVVLISELNTYGMDLGDVHNMPELCSKRHRRKSPGDIYQSICLLKKKQQQPHADTCKVGRNEAAPGELEHIIIFLQGEIHHSTQAPVVCTAFQMLPRACMHVLQKKWQCAP